MLLLLFIRWYDDPVLDSLNVMLLLYELFDNLFQKGRFCSVMHGKYDRLFLLYGLTLLSRAMMHDPKTFKNPMVYNP